MTSPLAEAGSRAVRDFLAADAPATEKQLHAWFAAGLTVRRRLVRAWLDELDSITAVTVVGERAYVRTEGAVRSVWRLEGRSVDVEMFEEVRPAGREDIATGVARLSQVLQRELNRRVTTT